MTEFVPYDHLGLAQLDYDYSPSKSAKNAMKIMDEWLVSSQNFINNYPNLILSNIAYGDHDRSFVDIFPAKHKTKKTIIFIHGGFWHKLSKDYFAYLSENFLKANYNFCTINYSLCPQATLDDIINDCALAIQKIKQVLDIDNQDIILGGHSAGGYLASLFPAKKAFLISGVFDLRPIILTENNDHIRLTEESAERLTITNPALSDDIAIFIGLAETEQFIDQSKYYHKICQPKQAQYIEIKDKHHFDILDELYHSDGVIFQYIIT